MQDQPNTRSSAVSRRDFLRTSSLAAATAAAAVSFPSVLSAQGKQTINAVIIGVGGRGGGAGGDFLKAAQEAGVEGKIVGVADIFPDAAKRGTGNFGVPADKCFSGFDAYKKVLEIPGVNYAIMATPPGFRPIHFKACIDAGKHVFMEKPVAVDGPGCRTVIEAAKLAETKGLNVVAGTQRRHGKDYRATIERIHSGAIGDVFA